MLASNSTSVILPGIPGLDNYQFWVAFPFCVMYVVAVTGNIIILYIIQIDHFLQGPMYLFLAMLATTDLVLSSSTQHKMLAILWFHNHKIEYHACLVQVFFTHAFSSVGSGVVMAMTLCCHVTIYFPLMFSWMPICLSHIVSYTYYEQVTMLIQICNILDHDPVLMAFSVVIFDIVNMTIGVTQVVLKLETFYLVFSTDSCSYTNMLCSKLPPPFCILRVVPVILLSLTTWVCSPLYHYWELNRAKSPLGPVDRTRSDNHLLLIRITLGKASNGLASGFQGSPKPETGD